MWSKFRRALRKEDQLLFDEMWRAPKVHLAAGAFIADEEPLDTIMMSMLLEQYKQIRKLERALFMLQEAHHDPLLGEPANELLLPP
ncbi:MAG: hypothetical protein ACHQQQ_15225 [Bacteroidota bacterium]